MLEHLHVKNLALIQEAEVDFTEGLNILTGETGAGKSLLIGSVNLALGGKVSRELIRGGEEFALVEMIFSVTTKEEEEKLAGLEVLPEDGELILSRKITEGRSINKINGEAVTAGLLRDTAAVMLDLHGQHEHQSLLQKRKHLEILDEFSRESLGDLKLKLAESYGDYQKCREKLENMTLDEGARKKEADFLAFEAGEIEEASLHEGEDEELEGSYRRMANAKKIREALSLVYSETGYEEHTAAGERIGRALRELVQAAGYDEGLGGLLEQLTALDGLLNDFNRDTADYLSGMEFGEGQFEQTQRRLDEINRLKSKYGKTIAEILDYQAQAQARLEELERYDAVIEGLEAQLANAREQVRGLCARISVIRKEYAEILAEKIKGHLVDLNFPDVDFRIKLAPLPEDTANGCDEVEFLISTNPGEAVKPLAKVASGGELSRIMLAIKTVLADQDDVGTVIFDEIDVGISGRTAQKVSEKMALIGKSRQVICITHLAQIAAMADAHFLIEKQVDGGETRTKINRLTEEGCVEELARILGGAKITKTVMESAKEMKKLAKGKKC